MCSYSCTGLPPELEANGDISGLGVVLGFTIMGWVTILLLFIYYICAFDPATDPFADPSVRKPSEHRMNPVDAVVSRLFLPMRSRLAKGNYMGSAAERLLNKCVLRLADAQLVTGLAIIISGYHSLPCGLSLYHWKSIVYLTWFACLTHLSALTFLRSYLHQHPAARAWRLFLMTALIVMLMVAFIPTGHIFFREYNSARDSPEVPVPFDVGAQMVSGNGTVLTDWSYAWDIYTFTSSPAICYFKGGMNEGREPVLSMAFSILLLVYGYFIRVGKLFEKSSTALSLRLHSGLDRYHVWMLGKWQRLVRPMDPHLALLITALIAPLETSLYFMLKLLLDFYSSMLLEISSLVIAGTWGSVRLAELRELGHPEDEAWGFGQVIPLILLATPLIPIFESVIRFFHYRGRKASEPNFATQFDAPGRAATYNSVFSYEPGGFSPNRSDRTLVRDSPYFKRTNSSAFTSPTTSFPRDMQRLELPRIDRSKPPSVVASDVEMMTHEVPDAVTVEVDRLFAFSRNAYDHLFGLQTLLVPTIPILTLTILVLVNGVGSLLQQSYYVATSASGLIISAVLVIPSTNLFMPTCLFYVHCWCKMTKKLTVGLVRFVICGGWGCFAFLVITMLSMDAALYSIGAVYAFHLTLVLVWTPLRALYLRQKRGRIEA